MKAYHILFLLLIMVLSSCSSKETEKTDIYRLHDIWALESIDGEKINPAALENLPVLEIYVEEERVHGNTGCNILDGKIEIKENKIKFSGLAATKMFCPGTVELKFLSALGNIDNYKIEKMKLHLFTGEEEKMVLRKIY